MIKVSIIIPVYNVAKHIERCLHSVLSQDYEGLLECIIVDDCTPDDSMQIAVKLLSEYTGHINTKICHHKQNCGLSAARNTGVAEADGDYIFFLDSDDEIMPHAISVLVALVAKYPNVDIVYGDWYLPRRFKGLHNDIRLPEYTDSRKKIARYLLSGAVSMTGPNKLIRKQYILDNHLTFKEGIIHEDNLFTYYLANTAHSIAISFTPIYVYYLNQVGITSTVTPKHILSKITLANEILDYTKDILLGYKYYYCINLLNGALGGTLEEYGLSSQIHYTYKILQDRAFKDRFYLIALMAFINNHFNSDFFQRISGSLGYKIFKNIVLRRYRWRKK